LYGREKGGGGVWDPLSEGRGGGFRFPPHLLGASPPLPTNRAVLAPFPASLRRGAPGNREEAAGRLPASCWGGQPTPRFKLSALGRKKDLDP